MGTSDRPDKGGAYPKSLTGVAIMANMDSVVETHTVTYSGQDPLTIPCTGLGCPLGARGHGASVTLRAWMVRHALRPFTGSWMTEYKWSIARSSDAESEA